MGRRDRRAVGHFRGGASHRRPSARRVRDSGEQHRKWWASRSRSAAFRSAQALSSLAPDRRTPGISRRGVGRRLKFFQRQDALKRGIGLVEWTFDPLELKNAHFNLVRLGAVARVLIPNCYGITGSALHAGLPTDRLVAEWWLDSDRVKSILADIALPSRNPRARISLPSNIRRNQVYGSGRWRARIQTNAREQFQKWFASGYVATAVEQSDGTTDYILEPANAIAGLSLPAREEH